MEDKVFKALADLSRRRLLDSLNAHDGQTLRELCAGLDMARQSVSKHLAVLESAHLVTTVRRGREKLHYLNTVPINALADRWMRQYDRERASALADLKTALEEKTMADATPAGNPASAAGTGLRLHDLHQDHTRTAVAGAHRTRLHQALLGCRLRPRSGRPARPSPGNRRA